MSVLRPERLAYIEVALDVLWPHDDTAQRDKCDFPEEAHFQPAGMALN